MNLIFKLFCLLFMIHELQEGECCFLIPEPRFTLICLEAEESINTCFRWFTRGKLDLDKTSRLPERKETTETDKLGLADPKRDNIIRLDFEAHNMKRRLIVAVVLNSWWRRIFLKECNRLWFSVDINYQAIWGIQEQTLLLLLKKFKWMWYKILIPT